MPLLQPLFEISDELLALPAAALERFCLRVYVSSEAVPSPMGLSVTGSNGLSEYQQVRGF